MSGSIVPSRHWQRTREVKSVMIEVRRDLYMDQETGEQRQDFGVVATRTARLVKGFYGIWERTRA